MLMDGAIDQTFAFQRQAHIQLHSAKIEQADKLQDSIPSIEAYFMQKIAEFTQTQGQSIQNYLASEKTAGQLTTLCQTTGVALQWMRTWKMVEFYKKASL